MAVFTSGYLRLWQYAKFCRSLMIVSRQPVETFWIIWFIEIGKNYLKYWDVTFALCRLTLVKQNWNAHCQNFKSSELFRINKVFYTYGRPEVCLCVCFCTIENIPRLQRDNHLVYNILSRGQTVGSDVAQSICYDLLLLATVYVGFIGECPTQSFGNPIFSFFC